MGKIGLSEILILLIGFGLFILWVWALVDIIKRSFDSDATKIIWFLFVLLFPVLGLIVYLVVGRKTKV